MTAHNLHDKIFKRLMSDKGYFIQTCKTYLPKKIISAIDWDNVQLYKIGGEFVTTGAEISEQQEERADIMYLVKIQQNDVIHDGIIIFNYEHYSTPRKLIPLITSCYALNAVKEYASTQGVDENLPMVLSVVYYHGKITPYPHTMELAELFSDPKLAQRHLLKPLLVDLGQYSDEDIGKHGMIAPAELMFKRAMRNGLSLAMTQRIAELINKHFPQETFPAVAMTMVQYGLYLASADKQRFVDTLLKVLPEHTGEIMNVAEQFKQEGFQQGAAETSRQMAINLLNNGVEPRIIAKSSNLTLAELKKLAKEAKNEDK